MGEVRDALIQVQRMRNAWKHTLAGGERAEACVAFCSGRKRGLDMHTRNAQSIVRWRKEGES